MIELEIKKSRFLAVAMGVQSLAQVAEELEKLKKQHKKATHICWACKINHQGLEQAKWEDDGEPSGTAGRPIFGVMQKRNAQNMVVFVVRYFGGVKLGAGGLVRAYTKATSLALDECK